ncbi:unnamed protein product, partial [Polarella glacialis]
CLLLGYLFGVFLPFRLGRNGINYSLLVDLLDDNRNGVIDEDEMKHLADLIMKDRRERGRELEEEANRNKDRAWTFKFVFLPLSLVFDIASIAACWYFFGIGYPVLFIGIGVLPLPIYCLLKFRSLETSAEKMLDMVKEADGLPKWEDAEKLLPSTTGMPK